MKNKKVMHLIASNFFGGPEKQIIEHLKLLKDNVFNGLVASFYEGNNRSELLEKANDSDIEHIGIPMSGPLDFRAQSILNRAVRNNRINLLCAHGYKACVMGWIASKRNDIPLLAFSRGYTSENNKVKFYNWLEKKVLVRADGLISVSYGQQEKLRKYRVRGKKNWVVHNAVNVTGKENKISNQEKDRFWSRFNIPSDALVVVTAGRFSPEKGHRYLVEAISKCRFNKKVFFLFCGEGQCLEDLKTQCQNLGIMDYCLFVGFRRDLMEIFKAMDLFVLPSLTEGLPNVVLEAFASGKPVISTSVGGVPELVEDGINGLLVHPKKSTELANAIMTLLGDNELRESMGMAGLQRVNDEFNFRKQSELLVNIYSDVMEVNDSL